GHHLLLGDEHLEVPLGEGGRELRGVGGVAHLAVERDDLVVPRAQGDQRVAVGLAGGDLVAGLVLRPVLARLGVVARLLRERARVLPRGPRLSGRRYWPADDQVADAAKL